VPLAGGVAEAPPELVPPPEAPVELDPVPLLAPGWAVAPPEDGEVEAPPGELDAPPTLAAGVPPVDGVGDPLVPA